MSAEVFDLPSGALNPVKAADVVLEAWAKVNAAANNSCLRPGRERVADG